MEFVNKHWMHTDGGEKLSVLPVQMAYAVKFRLCIGWYYTGISHSFTQLVELLTCTDKN